MRLKSRQLASLVNTAQMIMSENNVDEILEQITVQTSRLMKARVCAIFLLNDDSSELLRSLRRRGRPTASCRTCAWRTHCSAAW